MDLARIDPRDVSSFTDDELRDVMQALVEPLADDRKETQILYYQPASDAAGKMHFSQARVVGIGGGNRASKSDTILADITALGTGVFPQWNPEPFRERFQGPINIRIVCESLKTTLFPTILPKLQWWRWNGLAPQGGGRGHWGWIPKMCLKDGDWGKSWTASSLRLTTLCRNPDNLDEILGESTWQFMSYDQDSPDFASGSFHYIHHDEPPSMAIWRENEARVMDVGGRMTIAMTWPDDPTIPTDWISDEIYDRRDEDGIDWFNFHTTDNRNLDQKVVAEMSAGWSETTKAVRLRGESLNFSNRIHPLFTDTAQQWCFTCMENAISQNGKCVECGNEVEEYCHVTDLDTQGAWPSVFLLDPHPRKPHMWLWVTLDPTDDWWVVADGELDGTPAEIWEKVSAMEEEYDIHTVARILDPNMGASPTGIRRDVTWQDAFGGAGLHCELADDSSVGRVGVNERLKPDPYRRQPRLHIHTRCQNTIFQMKRYVWDNFKRSYEKDLKQVPKAKADDYPTLLKYCANYEPTFQFLREGGGIVQTRRRSG